MKKPIIIALILITAAAAVSAQVEIPGNRFFYIQSVAAAGTDQGFWDLPGVKPSYQRGANLCLYHKETGNYWDRLYMFRPAGDGYYYIMPGNGGFVDVAGGGTENGTNVIIWEPHKDYNQRFRLEHIGGDRFRIYTHSGQVLATDNRSVEDGTNVHIWEDHDVPATAWYLIERGSGKPFHVDVPVQPFGRVLDSTTGEPIGEASISLINTNDAKDSRYYASAASDGNFRFPPLESVEYGYDIVISAEGYGSRVIHSHSQDANGPHEIELTSAADYKQVDFGRFGTWLYQRKNMPGFYEEDFFRTNSHWVYLDGEVDSNDDFFFPDNGNRSVVVEELKTAIGLSGSRANTDEEIYEQLSLVWEFWRKNSRAVGLRNRAPRDQEAWDALYLPSPLERWPSVEEYAEVYRDFGFIPSGNCTSHSLGFAALMSLTGISPKKMGVEVMHMTESVTGEHWAFIIRLKGVWYWIDPQQRYTSLSSLEEFQSIPARIDSAAYDRPYKLVSFPHSRANGVPLLGRKIGPMRETGINYDPTSIHLKYAEARFGGNEPFWSLRLDNTDKIFFTPWPGAPTQQFRVDSVRRIGREMTITGRHRELESWMPGGRIYFVITETPTADDMSGQIQPYGIQCSINGMSLTGTGFMPEVK